MNQKMTQKDILIASQTIIANDKDEKIANLEAQLRNAEKALDISTDELVRANGQKADAEEKWQHSFGRIQTLEKEIEGHNRAHDGFSEELNAYEISIKQLKLIVSQSPKCTLKTKLQKFIDKEFPNEG